MTVIIRPDIGWTWGYTALVVAHRPDRRRAGVRADQADAARSARTSRIAAGRSLTARSSAPSVAEEQEHAPGDRLARGRLERDRVRRALEPVARDLGVEVGVVAPRVGLVVDDDETVGRAVDEVDVALERGAARPAWRRTSRAGSRAAHRFAHRVASRARRGRARRCRAPVPITPSAAACAAAVSSMPAPVARSTVCSTACTARPIAVPYRPLFHGGSSRSRASLARPGSARAARSAASRRDRGGRPHASARRRRASASSRCREPLGPRRRYGTVRERPAPARRPACRPRRRRERLPVRRRRAPPPTAARRGSTSCGRSSGSLASVRCTDTTRWSRARVQRDVEQAELLVEVHLLVDRRVALELLGGDPCSTRAARRCRGRAGTAAARRVRRVLRLRWSCPTRS